MYYAIYYLALKQVYSISMRYPGSRDFRWGLSIQILPNRINRITLFVSAGLLFISASDNLFCCALPVKAINTNNIIAGIF